MNWAPLVSITPVTGDVPMDPNAEFWTKRPGANVPLVGQVIADPRNFNPTVDMVTLRAVYTDQEAVFHLTWDDPTASDPTKGAPKPDMIAVQFPTGQGTGDRPYFLMGDGSHPVYLLTLARRRGRRRGDGDRGGQDGPAERGSGPGEGTGRLRCRSVPSRHPTAAPDRGRAGFRLPPGEFFPVALWAWDGSEGDDGPKAAVSTWYYARLEPPPSKRQFVMPPILALVVGAAELGLARWARRRQEAA